MFICSWIMYYWRPNFYLPSSQGGLNRPSTGQLWRVFDHVFPMLQHYLLCLCRIWLWPGIFLWFTEFMILILNNFFTSLYILSTEYPNILIFKKNSIFLAKQNRTRNVTGPDVSPCIWCAVCCAARWYGVVPAGWSVRGGAGWPCARLPTWRQPGTVDKPR